MKRYYFDYAATTPVDELVLEEMLPYFKEKFGNASSIHSFGQEARIAVEVSREQIASILNCSPGEILFTSGGTESINFALRSPLDYLIKLKKTTILTSELEHKATLETCKYLQKLGFNIIYCKPDENGIITLNSVMNSFREDVGLISLMHVNNETGHINDIYEIGEFCKNNNILFHVDAVQSFGKYKLDLKNLNVDFLSCSAHKIYGPKGIGFIYYKPNPELSPILFGGSQERKKRGGTENVAFIVGLAKAATLIYDNYDKKYDYVYKIKKHFINRMQIFDKDDLKLNSPLEYSSPYILNFSVNPEAFNISGDSIIMLLDLQQIAVSSGSACTSGSTDPSHVILALGLPHKFAKNSIRFSFSHLTTLNELNFVIDEFIRILTNAKK